MFLDREDAGKKLGRTLIKYKNKNVLVLAIPRGGVEVGFEVATYLNAELSILIARKLPFPDLPEAGFGAIAEDGSIFLSDDATHWVDQKTIDKIIKEQLQEIKRRIEVLRKNMPLPHIENRIVILVDDGIAAGSTMRACITLCKKRKVKKIVVAVPVTGKRNKQEVAKLVDEIVVLETPFMFRAVAQAYRNWYDVSNREVNEILNRWGNR
ncbi:phosphoribosyltransferase [candidate division TA06 bacterium DG_78]|uniref:Phosphoribosyltransferase n=1 Tax=candidate division TA06 bacterium DG_78 TaxID=1703772 RepID=A0A0S7YJG9_UNCT6|nr:MAG: phosphoribosyltransferase [candidate division TA06 bacterium DG_78]